MLPGHLVDGLAEGEGGGLEPLEQTRPQEPHHGPGPRVFRLVRLSKTGLRHVPGEGESPFPVRVEGLLQTVEEAGQPVFKRVAHAYRPRLGKDDGLGPALGSGDRIPGIVLLHELPCPLHRGRVDDWIEHVRAQAGRVRPHGVLEALADREDAPASEVGVLAQEEADQVVEIPERVVDRGGGQQQKVTPSAEQKPAERRGPRGRVGVAVVVGLVDNDELILVESTLKMLLVGMRALPVAKLRVVGQLLEGQALDIELMFTQECPPHAVTQRGRTDQEGPLPAIPVEAEDLPGDEGLPESYLIGDNHAAGIAHQPQSASNAMLLEARQRQIFVRLRVFLHLVSIEVPQHPDEDVPRRPGLECRREDSCQIVGLGFLPKLVEPVNSGLDHGAIVAAEVELQVRGQTCTRQIGRAGDDPFGPPAPFGPRGEDVGLGVQERLLVAPCLHVAGPKRRDQLAQGRPVGAIEGQVIAFSLKAFGQAPQAHLHPPSFKTLRRLVETLALLRPPSRQVRSQQQANLRDLLQLIGDMRETCRAEEGGGDADLVRHRP